MSDTYYAKVENGIVTTVHVVSYGFIVTNPERYGDPELWKQTFVDHPNKTYAGIGFTYNETTQNFSPPPPPDPEEE